MFNGFHNGMGAGGWVLMAVLWVMILALIVWVVARLLPARSAAHQEFRKVPADGPREILDGRLARGEIDAQTYEELRAKLDPRSATGTG
jgi:putative membrane protein